MGAGMAAGSGQERRWARWRVVGELLLVIGSVGGGVALFFADLSERQRAGIQLYIWVLVARNVVTGYRRSRRESGGTSLP